MRNEVLDNRASTYYIVRVRDLFVIDVEFDHRGQVFSIATSVNESGVFNFELFDDALKVVDFLGGSIEKHTINRIATKQVEVISLEQNLPRKEETK